jgi:CheY-like chemotaxis protein
MKSNVWVKVVGFSDVERHSLNTLFRLSFRRAPSYSLWTPEAASPPHVALIDVDSYAAGMELASPSLNPNLKIISVGAQSPAKAWRSFQRPVDWHALVQVLDGLFASQAEVDIDLGWDELQDKIVPPGVKVSLVVGMARDERLYLRTRLALAGLTDVDESESVAQAVTRISQRHYDLVVVSLELKDADPWALVRTLKGLLAPPHAVIVVTSTPSWTAMEQAERLGCTGLLEIPFNPRQVLGLLQKV